MTPLLLGPNILYKIQHPKPAKQNQNKIKKLTIKSFPKSQHIFAEKQQNDKIANLNFNKIWKNTYVSYSQPHTKDLLFKFLHYAMKTNNFVYKISRDKTGLTPTANIATT